MVVDASKHWHSIWKQKIEKATFELWTIQISVKPYNYLFSLAKTHRELLALVRSAQYFNEVDGTHCKDNLAADSIEGLGSKWPESFIADRWNWHAFSALKFIVKFAAELVTEYYSPNGHQSDPF